MFRHHAWGTCFDTCLTLAKCVESGTNKKRGLARDLFRYLLFINWEYVHLIVYVCIQSPKKLARPFIFTHSILCQKVSKLHPIFRKSLKTVTMISAEASTAHQEQVLHNSTWELKFQMLLEFQARSNHVNVTQGNTTQLMYSWREMKGYCC
jgi:hypothetical protein